MSFYIGEIEGYQGILQGDVFRVGNNCREYFYEGEKWAVMITPDCDIANKKMGKFYTLLPIVSAENYIDEIWLSGQYKKIKLSICKKIVDKINFFKIGETFNCNDLSIDEFINWFDEESIADVFEKLDISKDKTLKIAKDAGFTDINGFNLFSEIINSAPTRENYIKIKKSLGVKPKEIKGEFSGCLKNAGIDYYFVPEIPHTEAIGAFIKLRDVRAIPIENAFANRQGAILNGKDVEESIYRVGRFNDYLKHSVSQKFAHLYSRIGLPEEFEDRSKCSIEFLENIIWEKINEI